MSEILSSKTVKTRKPHKCFGCGKVYPAETLMTYTSVADGGSVFSYYQCDICDEYVRRYFGADDEYGEGEIYDNDREGWEALRKEIKNETKR